MIVLETIFVLNKVGQGVLYILTPLFQIPNINTIMHAYTVFTFSILVYIPTIIVTLKPHSTLLKNCKSSCTVYMDTIIYNATS